LPVLVFACLALFAKIRSIVGVVEHGLFLGMASEALATGGDGVRETKAQSRKLLANLS
jgi:ribose 5-phosphate isomerase